MKKMFALLLSAVMMLSLLTACGSSDTKEETTGDTATEETSESALNVGVFYYNYSDAYITTCLLYTSCPGADSAGRTPR